MTLFRLITALCLACSFTAALAVPAAPPAAAVPAAAPAAGPEATRRLTLSSLGAGAAVALRTTDGRATLRFGVRADELVTRATVKLRYAFSPALIPSQSHLKLTINDEVVGVLPMTRENAGRTLTAELPVDPRLLSDYNTLTLQFIGHYTSACENPLNSSLWAEVGGASALELTVRRLAPAPELGRLPEPFFDARDNRRLALPFVFAARPAHGTLRAAAIAASWFGQLAAWRGSRFPVTLDSLPAGHAVVFATNQERPAALAALPPFTGPALALLANPADRQSLLLLVGGRDAAELRRAAQALVRGTAALSGSQASVGRGELLRPRAAYDAPNWVPLDRPVKFGELVAERQQLQVFGHQPPLVRLDLRVAPDLFAWNSRGVPVELKFRYTPLLRAGESRLSMSMNDELVQSINLHAASADGAAARVLLPLLDGGMVAERTDALVPAFRLGSRNQLQYGFSFAYQQEGACRDGQVDNVRAIIDADSTIDFSGLPHYARLPHLGYFGNAGFPFTKYADLGQTTVVLPERPSGPEIELMLGLMGRMGESTGYPATMVEVAGANDTALLKERDLLLLGAAGRQPLLQRWQDKLPAALTAEARIVRQPVSSGSALFDWFGFGSRADPDVATLDALRADGALALLTGFESPLSAGRSVVAVTAAAPQDLPQVLDTLDDAAVQRTLHGSAVFMAGKRTVSLLVGETYTVGELPLWTAIWYPLSSHPILLAVLAVLAVLVFAFALWRSLRALAARRLREPV